MRQQRRTAGEPVVVFLDIAILGGRHMFLKKMAVEELPADRLQRVRIVLIF